MSPFSAEIKVDGRTLVAAGFPPFQVIPCAISMWFVAGRDSHNCVAHTDGIRAVFDEYEPAVLLCQEMNRRATR